jgi:hypothetical protein
MKFPFVIGKTKWKIERKKNVHFDIKYWINKKKARWRRLVLFTFLPF